MNNPKISVVIPVYNNEAYLEAAVRSIMSQTMNELEIILVNDGSTDRSGDIIQSLASEDDRIKVISQQNQRCIMQEILVLLLQQHHISILWIAMIC
jgi:glycosyltransferase involved in cell wall biosynthesis